MYEYEREMLSSICVYKGPASYIAYMGPPSLISIYKGTVVLGLIRVRVYDEVQTQRKETNGKLQEKV